MRSLNLSAIFVPLVASLVLSSCRGEDIVWPSEDIEIGDTATELKGFYLLNEGNMGSNKSTLDFYDFETGVYSRNIYAETNPNVPKQLGDVGNDLKIYGSKLYAVINCSNKVEVMNCDDAKRIAKIDIPNCRSIAFSGPYAYVTSYAGPVQINPNYEQIGYVAKIDTATLEVVDRCNVGFQPDGLAVLNDSIYVANSGGYMSPNYENTLSVIDLHTFVERRRIPIAINLNHVKADSLKRLWITTRGDYISQRARLFCYDPRNDELLKTFDVPANNFVIQGDSLYFEGVEWSYLTMSNTMASGIINIKSLELVRDRIVTDGTDAKIEIPYGLAVNPLTKDIYVTDARDYVTPGYLYCFSNSGVLKWSVRTGDIPAHFAFLPLR